MRTLPLPDPDHRPDGCFWRPNRPFIDELARNLAGLRVLEIFAGNGLLAAHLESRGVDIISTSLRSSHDAHRLGLYHPVLDMEACQAVEAFKKERDILLLCWPTVTDKALKACEAFGGRICYIGEATDYEKNHLGGCATDEFFERFENREPIAGYKGNMLEIACIGTLSPSRPEPRGSRSFV